MPQYTEFTEDKAVLACLTELETKFGPAYKKLIVSDTLDEAGHQYVSLVQKGGGVLGIALVGYTFVLESVGIRFLKLAGTSAGAINTALLAAMDYDQLAKKGFAYKSEQVVDYLCRLKFFDLVDGHPFAQWLIRKLLTNSQSKGKAKWYALYALLGLGALLGVDVLLLGLRHRAAWAEVAAQMSFVLSGIVLTAICGVVFYGLHLLDRFKERGYGINPGNFFYTWIRDRLKDNGVETVSQLQAKVAAVPKLRLRRRHPQNTDMLTGEVTFIASEIVSKNKVEFPKMCALFSSDANHLKPARFVRASMAIPFFFESHLITDIQKDDPVVKKAWQDFFGVEADCIPEKARLVDGGVLSNFPVSVFYNPSVEEPRLPVFGIDLDDSPPPDEEADDTTTWRLGKYLANLLDTLRGYYDKDFLLKNRMFRLGIGTVPLTDFNWLNFFLTDQEKLAMFVRGAQAAQAFLEKFDWAAYQQARVELRKHLPS